jgi:hypothetical protein
MCLKLKEKIKISPTLVTLIYDNYGVIVKFFLLASNMKREVLRVLESFISYPRKYDAIKTHNLFLMLEHKIKSFCLISSDISLEGVTNVEEYDKKYLYPMTVKCHNHLHLVSKSKVGCEDPMVEEDCSLDIFEQTTSTNELMK